MHPPPSRTSLILHGPVHGVVTSLLHLHLREDILVLVDQASHLPQIEDASQGVRLHMGRGASPLLYLHLHEHTLILADQDPFLLQMEDTSQDVGLHTVTLHPKPVETQYA